MQKKIFAFLLPAAVIGISIFIMILPTYFTKNVSRIVVHQELKLPLILNDKKDIKLVFFGYSGCVKICTPRLKEISKYYQGLDANTKKRMGVEFLDISQPHNKTLPNDFAKLFHEDFKGIYLDDATLREYTKSFKVYFSQSLFDETEYDHSSHLYLIKKDKDTKSLRFIYTAYPFDFKQIQLDIEELLNE